MSVKSKKTDCKDDTRGWCHLSTGWYLPPPPGGGVQISLVIVRNENGNPKNRMKNIRKGLHDDIFIMMIIKAKRPI